MLNNSIASVEATDPHLILRNSLQRTAACYSLDTTMARQISIDKMVMSTDPSIQIKILDSKTN